MKRIIKIHYLGLVLAAGLAVHSLPAESLLRLETALQRAEASNPGLKKLRTRYEAAQARVDSADALPDPRLQVSVFGESIQTRAGPQERAYSLSQTIPWWSKLSTRERAALSAADVYKAAYQTGVLMLSRDVRITYYELAYLVHAVTSTEAHLKLLEELHEVVEDQVRSGQSTNALLRLEVEMERQGDRLDTHRAKQLQKNAELQAYWSAPASGLLKVNDLEQYKPDLIETLSLDSLQQKLLADYPGLNGLRQAVARAGHEVDLAKLSRRPDFSLSLNYIEVDDVGDSVPHAGDDPWSVSVAVNLPIWEGKNRAEIRSALAARDSAEAALQEEILALKSELAGLVALRNNSADRAVRFEQKLIPLAEQALENTRSSYISGSVGILDLIDSERALIDLQLSYWLALTELLQSDACIGALTQNFEF